MATPTYFNVPGGGDEVRKIAIANTAFKAANLFRAYLVAMQWIVPETLAATAMAGASVAFPLAGVVSVFVSLGMPVAQAHALVREKGARDGFCVGLAVALGGHPHGYLLQFANRSPSSGVMLNAVRYDYPRAFNTALVTGYQAGSGLSPSDRKTILENLLRKMQTDGTAHMALNGSERNAIEWFAGAIRTHMIR